ncbi:hypothetical protein GCM10010909_02360 [Acidocella aquatica]|uniref:Uncharacterized protein n=1 Tax=Acidocella aquatica TaxID=1922313 RepID=A0ABQ6A1S3_9PROT|nr:hypothetical protein [Acidocella aquatica]GLR65558.1 hypothetical protein GCM10010909_02360 [Acidocella aquatica]
MGNALQSVLSSVFSFCEVLLNCAGWVNDAASSFLSRLGIPPSYQLYVFLVILVAVSVFALRWLGGFMGWLLVLLLLLLLLQRVLPDFTSASPQNLPVIHPLQSAL